MTGSEKIVELTAREEVEILGDTQLLKRYFDYQIYFNDSSYVFNRSSHQKVFFVVDSHYGYVDLIYDPVTKSMLKSSSIDKDNTYFLYLRIINIFRIYTKRYVDSQRTIEYTYKGVYSEPCCESDNIEVELLVNFLGL